MGERVRSLDGLRGVAATVVLIHHGLLVLPDIAAPYYGRRNGGGSADWFLYSPLHIIATGTESVLVFFVLSGFVLTLPVVTSHRFSWRSYFPSRLARLYLPVIAAVTLSLALVTAFPRQGLSLSPSPWLQSHDEILVWTTPLRDAALVGGASTLDGPLWSLRWEVIFSLLLPVYVWCAVRTTHLWKLLIPLALVLTGVVHGFRVASLSYLLMFALGALVAANLADITRLLGRVDGLRLRRWIWAAVAVACVLALTARWTTPFRLNPFLVEPLVSLGALLALVLALRCAPCVWVLGSRPFVWLGTISFSLYLIHEPIVVVVAQNMPTRYVDLTLFISTPLSLVAAVVFFRLVEKPSHRAARWISRNVHDRTVKPAGANPPDLSSTNRSPSP